MTQLEYQNQNKLGFEGDTFLKETFKNIVKDFNINHIIETGTYHGYTTKHLAKMVDRVDTIEVVELNYLTALKHLKRLKNVNCYIGNSSELLESVLPIQPTNLFCFLDAHWQQYNPLIDELKVIAKSGLKPIIAIHDFKVPNRDDLGYDVYKQTGIVYEWNWIAKSIEAIYGKDGYSIKYNDKSTGAKRGVIFIFPK